MLMPWPRGTGMPWPRETGFPKLPSAVTSTVDHPLGSPSLYAGQMNSFARLRALLVFQNRGVGYSMTLGEFGLGFG
jgi:hypothetical protein